MLHNQVQTYDFVSVIVIQKGYLDMASFLPILYSIENKTVRFHLLTNVLFVFIIVAILSSRNQLSNTWDVAHLKMQNTF